MAPNDHQPRYQNGGPLYLLHGVLAYRHSHQRIEPHIMHLRRNGPAVRG